MIAAVAGRMRTTGGVVGEAVAGMLGAVANRVVANRALADRVVADSTMANRVVADSTMANRVVTDQAVI